jgi:hypothetical protein
VQNLKLLLVVMVGCGGGSSMPMDMPDASETIDAPVADGPSEVTIEVLAPNETRPSSIAVANGSVVWTTDPPTGMGQVRQFSAGTISTLSASEDHPVAVKLGMGFSTLEAFWGTNSLLGQIRQIAASGQPPLTGTAVNDVVYSIALDGDSVFAGTRSRVYKKNVANASTPTAIATGYGNGVLGVTADAAGVVFTARTVSGTWQVASVSRNGGTVTPLATSTVDQPLRDVVIAGANVYWIDRTMIKSVPRAGGMEAIVKTYASLRPWAMVAAQGKLYIALNQGVIDPSGATGRIVELDPVTKSEREIAKEQSEPTGVAVDASYIYWSNRGVGSTPGQIVRIARE